MRTQTERERSQRGSSLVEVLIASLITSTAVLAFLMGVTTTVRISVFDRDATDADAQLRSAAEAIAAEPYVACGLGAQADYAQTATAAPDRAARIEVVSVSVWNGSVDPIGFVPCGDDDPGLQQLVLRAVDRDGATVGELTVFKRRT